MPFLPNSADGLEAIEKVGSNIVVSAADGTNFNLALPPGIAIATASIFGEHWFVSINDLAADAAPDSAGGSWNLPIRAANANALRSVSSDDWQRIRTNINAPETP